jgi:signal transduction histidine kinase
MSNYVRNTIFIRVFFLFGTLVLAITLFFIFMIIPMQKSAFQQIMYAQAETVSKSIVQASSDAIISKDYGFIVEHTVEVMKNSAIIYYILVSPKVDDKIWISHEKWHLLDKTDDEFSDLETENIAFKIISGNAYKKVYHFVYPIKFSGVPWGWLHIGFSTDQYDEYINSMYLNIIYMISISLLLILLIGFFFARWISQPVATISKLATQVASGNLTVRSTIDRKDEIGVLSDSFNQMVDSLRLSKLKLENYNLELEEQVSKRVQELDELNKDLDIKIRLEVAKRQKNEALLIHQSRLAAMGEMIGAIAHQWRQPLNALGLVLQNLHIKHKLGKLDEEFMLQSMDKSERLIKKMSSTIDDFRNFFKPNKNVELFNVKSTILATADLIEAQLNNYNIKLRTLCNDNITILGLQGEFSQVILNLINNAKDILVERQITQPEIIIKVEKITNGLLTIIVSDNGRGIAAAIMDKIYDPYFTTKEEGKGTGIGLYMSKIIIENNMGGKLYAFNDASGANFVIQIKV